MARYNIESIGVMRADKDGFRVELDKKYAAGLHELEGFSHVNILWWFSGCDNEKSRARLLCEPPYRSAPGLLGVFATRSPERPNPIALDTAYITYVDEENGVVGISYTEAHDGSPVLDLKPYEPSLDRVERPRVPSWCAHWPRSLEESADFDWDKEFTE